MNLVDDQFPRVLPSASRRTGHVTARVIDPDEVITQDTMNIVGSGSTLHTRVAPPVKYPQRA